MSLGRVPMTLKGILGDCLFCYEYQNGDTYYCPTISNLVPVNMYIVSNPGKPLSESFALKKDLVMLLEMNPS